MTVPNLKHVRGARELGQALKAFPTKMQNTVMRGAVRAAAKPVQDEARLQAPKNTGEYAKGIKTKTSVTFDRAVATVRTTGRHGYLANWLEFTGAAPHEVVPKRGKGKVLSLQSVGEDVAFASVKHPGMKPQPHLRPALDTKSNAALSAMGNRIRRFLSGQGAGDFEGIEEAE